jgi:hypothetical protein
MVETAINILAIALPLIVLLIVLFAEYGKRTAAERAAEIYCESLCQSREDAARAAEHYQATIDSLTGDMRKLSMQLAARTFEQAQSLEPNTITSITRTDTDLLAISKAKIEADRREDAMYEQIGTVR